MFACADVGDQTGPDRLRSAAVVSEGGQQDALAEVTRAVAMALADQGLRQRVRNDLRNSRHTFEHKLEFRRYLRGNSGGILLAKMANRAGVSRAELLQRLETLPPLEFYMPVRAHRESWRGGPDLIVAAALDEEGSTLVAYDLEGRPVQVSIETPPETPTLVLVPVETDFDQTLDLRFYKNHNDNGGQSIGTYVSIMADEVPCDDPFAIECGGGGGGGGGNPPPPPAYVQRRGRSVEEFITHMRALNDHEPWINGAPEFFLLLAGKHENEQDFELRINIPEGPWSGSDDDNNRKWRNFGMLSLIMWDDDLGTRIKVQCYEDDGGSKLTIKVKGDTTFPLIGKTLGFEIGFEISDGDDNCGSTFINYQNTAGLKYGIPDGLDNDIYYPDPPYFNGTSDLQWYGIGIQRLP